MTKKNAGFTLVEIMIVVAIIGLLAAIAIPSFIKARQESQAKGCVNNLRILDAAKQQAAMENGWTGSQAIGEGTEQETQALAYVKNNDMPTCPANGTYTWGNLDADPSCSVGNDHTL